MSEQVDYRFTIFVADSEQGAQMADDINNALEKSLPSAKWVIEVVDVLEVPEKALSKNIFATPTVVRDMPTPVVKVLANIANIEHVVLTIIDQRSMHGGIL